MEKKELVGRTKVYLQKTDEKWPKHIMPSAASEQVKNEIKKNASR